LKSAGQGITGQKGEKDTGAIARADDRFVDVRFQDDNTHEDTTTIIEQITERLAAALDNARLAEEIRDRAQRETLISETGGPIPIKPRS